ncbi:hypothetical protein KUCAC02_032391, partial [Chaenocephalus aceratus]
PAGRLCRLNLNARISISNPLLVSLGVEELSSAAASPTLQQLCPVPHRNR